MTKKEKASQIAKKLKSLYPEVKCELNYTQPHELLIATRLSAQCKDSRVNEVTAALFADYPDIDAFAAADCKDIERYIFICGLFKKKSEDIVNMCRIIKEKYNGVVPDTIEELVKLPGVGRKTANLIVGDLYGKPAVVCDTHVIRLSGRLGLDGSGDPIKVEKTLRGLLKEDESLGFCHRLVRHGRLVCDAKRPECDKCELSELCSNFQSRNQKTQKKRSKEKAN